MSSIRIDFSKETGPVKIMHAVNNGPKPHKKDQMNDNFTHYKAARIPYARNHDAAFASCYGGEHTVDIHLIFPNFDADENDPASYDFFYTDRYIRNTLDAGTETFYRLGSKIEHGPKKYGTLPPKDFHKWARICEHVIRHYNEGWADGFHYNIQYWEIWNEPDLDADDAPNKRTWSGTWAQFFDLYAIAATHLKGCFPNLKIGGPALAYRVGWMDLFLPEMKKRGVPIDFFSWHFYSNDAHTAENRAREVQAALDQYGYGDAESICNEWNYVKGWSEEFVYSIKQIIGIKGAAFSASTMIFAHATTMHMMMYYDARPTAFNGLFDFYTSEPLKGYYPFVMWSKLRELGSTVALENDDSRVAAIAAKGADGKGAVMLSYFCEDDSVSDPVEMEIALDNLDIKTLTEYPLDRERTCEAVSRTARGTQKVTLYPNSVTFLLCNGQSLFEE
ncbi:MAG: hypothetical protein IJW29_03560 [Clostridia bacterium]|nr:hypothetical protein [Clostridia bacterium]